MSTDREFRRSAERRRTDALTGAAFLATAVWLTVVAELAILWL